MTQVWIVEWREVYDDFGWRVAAVFSDMYAAHDYAAKIRAEYVEGDEAPYIARVTGPHTVDIYKPTST